MHVNDVSIMNVACNLNSQLVSSTFSSTINEETTQVKRMKYQESINMCTYPDISSYRTVNSITSSNSHNSSNEDDNQLLSNLSFNSNSNSSGSPVNKAVNYDFYGLPNMIKSLLKELRKIESLYEWQDELLNKVRDGYDCALKREPFVLNNLLYLSPTR